MSGNEKSQSLSKNLADTIAKSGDIELPAEILEFTVDQIMDDGILKDIPIVGWIAKGISAANSISDRILYHKVLRFLIALEKNSQGKRADFLHKVESDPKYGRKVGEHLLVIINKIDAFEKTTLLAKCFDHFLTEDLDFQYFVDLSNIIERTPISDLKALSVPENQRISFNSVGVAVACGILEFGITNPSFGGELPELGTKMSKYGRDLRYIFLGQFRDYLARRKAQRDSLFESEG